MYVNRLHATDWLISSITWWVMRASPTQNQKCNFWNPTTKEMTAQKINTLSSRYTNALTSFIIMLYVLTPTHYVVLNCNGKKTEMEWGRITLSQVGFSGKLLLVLPCTDTDSVSYCSSGNSSERWLHQSLVCHEDLPHTQHPHHHDLVLETHHPHEQTSCPAREVRPPHYQYHSDDL